MKKYIILFMVTWYCVFSVKLACAQGTVPVTPMQNMISGVLGARAIQSGFQVSQPAFVSEIIGVGAAFGRWAAAAVVAGAMALTAPVWGILAGAALVGTGVYLAATSDIQYVFNADKKTVTMKSPATSPTTAPIVQGGPFYGAYSGGKLIAGGNDPQAVAGQYAGMIGSGWQMPNPCTGGPTTYQCTAYQYDSVKNQWGSQSSFSVVGGATGAPTSCGANRFVDSAGACHAFDYVPGKVSTVPIADGYKTIPPGVLTQPLNPAISAKVIDQAWQDAASQPGYAGLPYDYTHPITIGDVQAWQQGHSGDYPTVADWTAPLVPGNNPYEIPLGGATTPVTTQPGTQTGVGTNSAGTNPQVNLGADPGIGSPQLESTPTAKMILDPVLSLLPDFKNFSVAPLGGTCPKPTFEAFSNTFTLDKHCDLLEQNRSVIKASMMLVYALASLFIILRA